MVMKMALPEKMPSLISDLPLKENIMPANSEKARKAAGVALRKKRTGKGKLTGASKSMSKMSEVELSKMAKKKKK